MISIFFLMVDHSAIGSWSQNLKKLKENENLTSIVMQLQARFDNLTDTKKESGKTADNIPIGLCPVRWIEVNRECLYISPRGVSKSWSSSKKDCEDRGGRLVTVKTRLKLQALSLFFTHIWIGLSDNGTEDVWRWEDGTNLDTELNFWMKDEPNNHNDDEDCAQLSVENGAVGFNDNNCGTSFSYICEASG
uniref:C-type lectin domain-containing protein n=1 Tax=Neogobius melanostomus TaxID=47308 RepID=A0A8C6UR82_9GOBI